MATKSGLPGVPKLPKPTKTHKPKHMHARAARAVRASPGGSTKNVGAATSMGNPARKTRARARGVVVQG